MIERYLMHDGGHSVVDYGGREGGGEGKRRRMSERDGEKERESGREKTG